uniref:Oxysterol-binding protein n=1 Tax=Timspurckia oligopyrenoides TaxID=708627 RepID=A0A7S0ZB59_9RHOD|mmetsp:Transcript_11005/g.19886  ORF Transcript_11005/g.19886 Transcript_11005/m.19886 type:complete len:398 (+) Transcript_11005:83-1276(+)|eukprot:CAMPEP_0182441818 /NCGR_PEP_ID=MMETSP1172-20130603/814_1 /TAXON_ID=708627 /ORGANISM="Timspurckia oligopyrenoides, Strain CCMP3278" /LENGTH=397 /DNA_ID=CAMNT_0024636373 /DNA_START=67 /DNA_END=1260 /DNA_ORIENTATION=+
MSSEVDSLSGGLQKVAIDAVCDHHQYTINREIDYGEHAPDSGISVIKVAKELLGGLKTGADLTGVNLPASVLDPMSSLEKAAKSMQRGEMIADVVSAKSEEDRFLQIFKFQLSGLPKERFGKKPYNPILGEVFRAVFKHADSSHGTTLLLAEQVSHHPPITAIFVHNKTLGFKMQSFMKPEPRFYGNSIEITLSGLIEIEIEKYAEKYHLVRPTIRQTGILGISKQSVEFIGVSTIKCEKTDLMAEVEFKTKSLLGLRGEANMIAGKIKKISTGEKIYEISGVWDKQVKVKDLRTKKEIVLFDYEAMKEKSLTMWTPSKEDLEPNNSLVVWEQCSEAIWAVDTAAANEEKKKVEDAQRALRKQRQEQGLEWKPVFFMKQGEGYVIREDVEEKLAPRN